MKYVALLFVLLLTRFPLFAQTCQQVEVATTAQQKQVIREYIEACTQKHYFFEDKGVVNLVIYRDAAGLTCWYISALVDDRYRSLPPERYAFFGNNVILVYQGDQEGRSLPIPGNKASRDACIQEVIGSRVYECSTKKQFVYTHDATGKVQKVPVTHMLGGNLHNELIIRFNKDGTITKFLPV